MMVSVQSPRVTALSNFEEIKENDGEYEQRLILCQSSSFSVNLRHHLVCDKIVACLEHESLSHVKELWLGPTFEDSETVLSAICSLPRSLIHLDLDLRNALPLLPEAIPLLFSHTQLETLSLRFFGDTGATELAKSLHRNPHLKTLDLRGNRIGSVGARAIVDALVSCQHGLNCLILSCNCIIHGDMLSKLLSQRMTKLECLDLSFNWIDNTAIKQICHALQQQTSSSLRELNLFGCQRLSEAGLQALLDCLENNNSTLRFVNTRACGTGTMNLHNQLAEKIDNLLMLNRSGRYLLHHDEIPIALWSRLLEKCNNEPDAMYYFLRENPRLFL